ncbi:MAG TPA: hypothetical protein VFH99_02865 [Candidatus Saccharimonadales bacterium]|nr:hypothetical protein [Candidatus Saccharimonadales bacterium]
MINLLPPEIKENYRYGRRNVSLRKWAVGCLAALVGLGIITTYGLLVLQQSTNHYNHKIAASKALFKKEDFTGTQAHVQDISNSFKLVVKVLGKEVLFSQLIKQIGASMPANANLTGLDISSVQGGLDITANAIDYKTATQVQVNLSDPANKIFDKADIVNITCNDATNSSYPCQVTIRALFAKNNPFLFINNKTGQP